MEILTFFLYMTLAGVILGLVIGWLFYTPKF